MKLEPSEIPDPDKVVLEFRRPEQGETYCYLMGGEWYWFTLDTTVYGNSEPDMDIIKWGWNRWVVVE